MSIRGWVSTDPADSGKTCFLFVSDDAHGLRPSQNVVVYPDASDPVAEEREAVRKLSVACQKLCIAQTGTSFFPRIYCDKLGRYTAYLPNRKGPRHEYYASAEADTEVAALRALRASLEPEEQPVPETIEEADAECRRRLPNNKGIMCQNDGDADIPRWRVYVRDTVRAAYLAIDSEWHVTCLAAWQAAARALREEASSDA